MGIGAIIASGKNNELLPDVTVHGMLPIVFHARRVVGPEFLGVARRFGR